MVYIRFNRVFTDSHFRFLRQEEERKEMFYLMMHSAHFIYGYMVSDTWLRTLRYWKEGNVLFNDTLNTFYLWLYDIRHMVKDHSVIERENPLSTFHGLGFC